VEEGRLAARLAEELVLGAQHFPLGRRIRDAERRCHFEYLAALHDAKYECQAATIRHPTEQAIERFERFAPFDVTRRDGHFGQRARRRETDPTTYLAPPELERDEANGDADQEPAQRRGISKRVDGAQERDEHVLQQIFGGVVGTEAGSDDASHQGGVPVPNDGDRLGVSVSYGFDELGVAESLVGETRDRRDDFGGS